MGSIAEQAQTLMENCGETHFIGPGAYTALNQSRINFGIIRVSEGTVSLYLNEGVASSKGGLIKTFKRGELIMVDIIKRYAHSPNLVLYAGPTGAHILHMDYDQFAESFFGRFPLMQSIVESNASCVSQLVNRHVMRRKNTPEEKVAQVLLNAANELGEIEQRLDKDGYIILEFGQNDIASMTGMGVRTIRRACSTLMDMSAIKETTRKKVVCANYDALTKIAMTMGAGN